MLVASPNMELESRSMREESGKNETGLRYISLRLRWESREQRLLFELSYKTFSFDLKKAMA